MTGPKVTLIYQKLNRVSDGVGGYTEKWSSVRKIKGTLETIQGTERFYSQTNTIFQTNKFFCDHQYGLEWSNIDRLVLGERIFEIVYFDNVAEQNRFMEITLKEIY